MFCIWARRFYIIRSFGQNGETLCTIWCLLACSYLFFLFGILFALPNSDRHVYHGFLISSLSVSFSLFHSIDEFSEWKIFSQHCVFLREPCFFCNRIFFFFSHFCWSLILITFTFCKWSFATLKFISFQNDTTTTTTTYSRSCIIENRNQIFQRHQITDVAAAAAAAALSLNRR